MKNVLLILAVAVILLWTVLRERQAVAHSPAVITDNAAQDAVNASGEFAAGGTQLHTLNPDILAAGIGGSSGSSTQALFYGGSISTGG